jgi:hypothetical protein
MRKRYLLNVAGGCVLTATRVINAVPVNAQVGNYGCGSSTAAGSGGLPTTGLTNIGTLGYGLSTGAGPAATATGPTNSGSAAVPAHGWGRNPAPRRVEHAGDRHPLSDGDSWGREQLARHAWNREQRIGDRSRGTCRGRTIGRGWPIGWRGSIGRHGRINGHGPIGRHRRERTVTLLNHLNDTDHDAFAQFSIVNT